MAAHRMEDGGMRHLRTITLAALALLAVGGWAGGLALVTDPTGGRLGMTVDQLPSWPLLGTYLVPGVLLILLFGLLPAAAFVQLLRRSARGWSLTTAVGVLLVLWMLGQVAAIGLTFPLMQTDFLLLGIALTGLGLDGGTQLGGADESRGAVRSYRHGDDDPRPRPPDRRGGPRGERRPGRPADRYHPV
jgi:hypothetical protein